MVLRSFKRIALALGISNVTFLLYLNMKSELEVKPYPYKMLQPPSGKYDPEMKTILLWTVWWNEHAWMIPFFGFSWEDNAHVGLADFGCDEGSYKCRITDDRSYLEDVNMFDGLMFHQSDITADLPDQTKRKANQVYIFHTRETPKRVGFNIGPEFNNFFNVTHSYSSKSGIHSPYGKFVKIRDHPEGEDLDNYIINYGKKHTRSLEGMNFSGTIMNSNCQSQSNREGLLAELGTMMQVDLFGRCGKPAPLGNEDAHSKDGHFGKGYYILGKTYPFIFSFENSLCDDYVSERFFETLDANVVPVVYNGANMSKIAPKHSYIDVKDFVDLKEVVNHLHKVYSDPVLYSSYFWWRDFYELETSTHVSRTMVKIFCDACRYLHAGHGARVVEDLYKEWVEGSCNNTLYGL